MSEAPLRRRPPNPQSGMTTNERLFVADLLDAFNAAAIARDRAKMIEILVAANVLKPDAEQIVDIELTSSESSMDGID